jgi:hypothetical protein
MKPTAGGRKYKKSGTATEKRRPRKQSGATPSLSSLFPAFRKAAYIRSVRTQRETLTTELREAYHHAGLVLYLGAGVSRSVGLPGWSDLIRSLTVTMMTRKVQTAINALGEPYNERYWSAVQGIQRQVEKETESDRPILMMARSIKDELGESLPMILTRTLYRPIVRHIRMFGLNRTRPYKSTSTGSKLPSSALLDAIVSLTRSERGIAGVHAIVNYNFDDLVEEKLQEENVRCKTVRSGSDRVPAGTLPCYHVHGVLPLSDLQRGKTDYGRRFKRIGNFVFSEDEYHEEYSDAYRWSNMTQVGLLGRYIGLFVGLSMEDPNIRRLVDVTHRQYPEIPNYAILARRKALGPLGDSKKCVLRNLFETVETSSFSKIGVKVIWVDTFDEIPDVLTEICGVED